LLLEAIDGRRLKLGDTHPHMLHSFDELIEFYEAWGKPEGVAGKAATSGDYKEVT